MRKTRALKAGWTTEVGLSVDNLFVSSTVHDVAYSGEMPSCGDCCALCSLSSLYRTVISRGRLESEKQQLNSVARARRGVGRAGTPSLVRRYIASNSKLVMEELGRLRLKAV